jgi:hypothetical protein
VVVTRQEYDAGGGAGTGPPHAFSNRTQGQLRQDSPAKIVKRNDHLMDATRYLIVSGRLMMCVKPQPERQPAPLQYSGKDWMRFICPLAEDSGEGEQ